TACKAFGPGIRIRHGEIAIGLILAEQKRNQRDGEPLPMAQVSTELEGFRLWPGLLSRDEQEALRDEVLVRMRGGPLYVPRMPKSGQPMRVRMTNFGPLGWVTDKEQGYRYQATHPDTGKPWPDIPPRVLELWRELANYPTLPEACLVNL